MRSRHRRRRRRQIWRSLGETRRRRCTQLADEETAFRKNPRSAVRPTLTAIAPWAAAETSSDERVPFCRHDTGYRSLGAVGVCGGLFAKAVSQRVVPAAAPS